MFFFQNYLTAYIRNVMILAKHTQIIYFQFYIVSFEISLEISQVTFKFWVTVRNTFEKHFDIYEKFFLAQFVTIPL